MVRDFEILKELNKFNCIHVVISLTTLDPKLARVMEPRASTPARRLDAIARLPYGVKDLFQAWLEENFPDRKNKVLNRIKEMRGGKLNSSEFGTRMRGEGIYAEQIGKIFHHWRNKFGLMANTSLATKHFQKQVAYGQLSFF